MILLNTKTYILSKNMKLEALLTQCRSMNREGKMNKEGLLN